MINLKGYVMLLKFAPMWFDPPLIESKNTESWQSINLTFCSRNET